MKQIKVGDRVALHGTVRENSNLCTVVLLDCGFQILTPNDKHLKPLRPKRKRVVIKNITWADGPWGLVPLICGEYIREKQLVGQSGTLVWTPYAKDTNK